MAEKEEQSESVDKEAGSKKKLMVIVGGVVGVLILVGAGLFFSGFFDPETTEPTAEESMDADAESGSDADEDVNNDEGGDIAVNTATYHALMPPFMVNFPGGNIQVMKLAVSVMAGDQAVIDAVILHDPVIRNNILLMLSSEDPEVLKTAKGKAKLQLSIKTEINNVLDSMKISSSVKNVFFTDLVMQ